MDIYDVDPSAKRIPQVKRITTFLALFAELGLVYFALEFLFEWLWPARHGIERIWGMIVKAVFWAFLLSLTFPFKKLGQYQIVVDEDEISTRSFTAMSWLSSRTIPRSEVRTLVERRNGLLISRYNRIGTFFWGGIWIPKQIADYEYLKRLVSSWRVVNFT